MISTVYTAGIEGVNGFPVSVECALEEVLEERNGGFDVVGLPDNGCATPFFLPEKSSLPVPGLP